MVVAEASLFPPLTLLWVGFRTPAGCDHKPLRREEGAPPCASLAPRAKAVLSIVPIEGKDLRHPPILRMQAASTLSDPGRATPALRPASILQQSRGEYFMKLVAGVGFEPTTFGL